jgi:hypothetical protein
MTAHVQSNEKMLPDVKHPTAETSTEVDPSWKGFYLAGGISAILYVLLGLGIPTVQVLTMDYFSASAEYGGIEYLQFIAENRFWWLFVQTGVLGTSIFAIVGFIALYLALKHLNKSLAALGAVIAVTCQILFIAYYPVLLGTIYLSDRFVAASPDQQILIGAAAEGLIAINNAFNPLYESLFGISIMLFSLVMMKGVFHKSVAYLGIVTCPASLIALALWPVLGVSYFWWWILFVIWFLIVGWKLFRLGRA